MIFYKGKIVELHRHFNLIHMAQTDPEVQAWMGQSFRAVGPYFEPGGKSVASGLSFEEQKLLLPIVLGIEATDKDFRREVNNFYHNFLTRVPQTGLKLQISLQDDSKELSQSNLPINVSDYLIYRHVLNHPEVAKNETEAKINYVKKFYLVDKQNITNEAVSVNKLEDEAMSLYMRHKDDVIKTDQILVLFGVDITKMTHNDKVLKLKTLAQKNPDNSAVEQTESLKRFIAFCTDADLEYKYLVTELIGAKHVRKVGSNYLLAETNEKLGDSLEEVVLFLKNPKNSKVLLGFKAKYTELVKKGWEYLPKTQE